MSSPVHSIVEYHAEKFDVVHRCTRLSTEPCGTPFSSRNLFDTELPTLTWNVFSDMDYLDPSVHFRIYIQIIRCSFELNGYPFSMVTNVTGEGNRKG